MQKITLIWLLIVSIFPVKSFADDPNIKWKTITSPHFKVIFPQKYRKTAGKIIRIAERAHILLTAHMSWKPSSKTHIVVTGYTDSANGSATVYFRKTIQVFLTFPDDVSELSDFDDWLWILILHEYTHILHMDTMSRLPKLIDTIFGQLWVPNSILPTWVLESLAVFSETKFSSAGRNRGSIYSMMLRSAVYEGKFLSLDKITSAPIPYPHGAIPYLYGSRFLWYLAGKYGADNIKYMTAKYGSTLIPFGVNKSAKASFGKSFEVMYKEFTQYLKKKVARRINLVKLRGLRRGKKLTKSGEFKFYPSFHPKLNNQLAYMGTDGHSPTALKLINLDKKGNTKSIKTLKSRLVYPGPPRWWGNKIVFHALEIFKTFYSFNEIYTFDLKTKTTHKISSGGRYSAPFPLKNRIVASKSRGIASDLVLLNEKGKLLRTLIKGKESWIYSPSFSTDMKNVVFSQWKKGKRDIVVYSMKSGKTIKITDDRALDTDPVFTPDGKYILFASDRTGIFNIFAYHINTKIMYQVTNVISGAFAPSLSADGKHLAYAGYSAKGYDIYLMDFNHKKFLPAPDSLPTRMPPRHTPSIPALFSEKNYSVLPYLRPVAWFADYGFSKESAFSLSMMGFDPLMHHSWTFYMDTTPDQSDAEVNIQYTNYSTWIPISIGLRGGKYPKYNMWVNEKWQQYPYYFLNLEAATQIPVIQTINQRLIAYLYGSAKRGLPSNDIMVPKPDSPLPIYPEASWNTTIRAGGYYFDGSSSTYALDWEQGIYLSAYAEATKYSYLDDARYNLTFEGIIRHKLPFGKHTVLSAKANLGTSMNYNSSPFSLGGSVINRVLTKRPWSEPLNSIHGFKNHQITGDHFYSTNLYVTFPIKWIGIGYETLPFFLRRLSAKLFFDLGDTINDNFDLNSPLMGMGGELRFHIVEGYVVSADLVVGVTRGLGEYGEWGWYMKVGSPLPDSIF